MQLKAKVLSAVALAMVLGSGAAFAAGMSKSGKTLTPQQERMVACNKEATGKKGEERKMFMSTCLKGEHAASAPGKTAAAAAPAAAAPEHKMTQQEKMKSCSADAKTKALKGTARKTFMSTCLKGEGAAAAAH